MGKNNEYLEISKQIVANIGGMDNIQGTAHCATRLRIVLKDNDLADIEKLMYMRYLPSIRIHRICHWEI